MVSSSAKTVAEYLESLDSERREAIEAVREVILQHLPEGYEEGMQYGMISYFIPLERYPVTYNKQPLSVISLANQKNYMSLYLMCVYGTNEMRESFEREYEATGKRLNMGKSCVRFRKLDDLPLELIGQAVARASVEDFIAVYEASRRSR